MQERSEEGVYSETAHFTLTKKSKSDHVRDFFLAYDRLVVVFFSVLGAGWLVAETAIQFLNIEARGLFGYLLLVLVAIVITALWRLSTYRRECPLGFEKYSAKARMFAHLQPPMWEANLAKVLMAELVIPIDRQYLKLLHGDEFVIARRTDTWDQYQRWMQDRLANLKLMQEVSTKLLVVEFARILSSNDDSDRKALEILGWVESVARLYRESVEFERQARSVLVPDEVSSLHESMLDWAAPIRDAVQQVIKNSMS